MKTYNLHSTRRWLYIYVHTWPAKPCRDISARHRSCTYFLGYVLDDSFSSYREVIILVSTSKRLFEVVGGINNSLEGFLPLKGIALEYDTLPKPATGSEKPSRDRYGKVPSNYGSLSRILKSAVPSPSFWSRDLLCVPDLRKQ